MARRSPSKERAYLAHDGRVRGNAVNEGGAAESIAKEGVEPNQERGANGLVVFGFLGWQWWCTVHGDGQAMAADVRSTMAGRVRGVELAAAAAAGVVGGGGRGGWR